MINEQIGGVLQEGEFKGVLRVQKVYGTSFTWPSKRLHYII